MCPLDIIDGNQKSFLLCIYCKEICPSCIYGREICPSNIYLAILSLLHYRKYNHRSCLHKLNSTVSSDDLHYKGAAEQTFCLHFLGCALYPLCILGQLRCPEEVCFSARHQHVSEYTTGRLWEHWQTKIQQMLPSCYLIHYVVYLSYTALLMMVSEHLMWSTKYKKHTSDIFLKGLGRLLKNMSSSERARRKTLIK